MKGFDPDAPAEAPVALWTTARDGTITALHCPALEQAGVNPVVLIGQSLDRWLDGDARHPLLQACRRALDGTETPVRMHWGALTFTGRVTPLRDHAGRITGTIGELEVRRRTSDGFGADAMEETGDGSSRGADPGVIASLLSRALAVLATQAGWRGALLWRVEPTGRLSRIALAGDAARHESIAEP
ncbi:MAG: PAS domain-containing protein, partial [Vicinamibacterales bacterium]